MQLAQLMIVGPFVMITYGIIAAVWMNVLRDKHWSDTAASLMGLFWLTTAAPLLLVWLVFRLTHLLRARRALPIPTGRVHPPRL